MKSTLKQIYPRRLQLLYAISSRLLSPDRNTKHNQQMSVFLSVLGAYNGMYV
jgi:hypothetical protein